MTQRGDDRRSAILEAIPRLAERLGAAPTLDEIAAEIGLGHSATYKHLTLLREQGQVALVRRFSGWVVADRSR